MVSPPPMTRILILDGHPDAEAGHFIHAAARAYEAGASGTHEVRRIDVARLQFPLIRSQHEWTTGEPPADIREAQEALRWSEHVVLFYPMWLGDVPAVLKGFLEQVLRPDSAFRYRDNGLPEKLLAGRSARIVVSMGMPGFAYSLFYRAHSLKSLKRNVFNFVGIKPVRHTIIGAVEGSAAKRDGWLAEMRKLGAKAG